ncbi:m7GpppX diphosphatase-like [Nelusetta ayraudi]|uniref:m7GpppX diphosphatase-like n=1 Tax=Nelusetta ayraudi TaxID=303726 RepID=UPI003F72F3ED
MSDVAANREGDTPENEESQLNAKRAKCDVTDGQGDHGEGEPACKRNILSGFVTSQILNDSAREKKIFVHGKLDNQEAVVIMEKTPIREENLAEIFSGSRLELDMRNDIYSTYRLQAPAHLSEIKTTVVCPATENHVKKYRRQETFLVEEREDDYGSITLPYVEKLCLGVQWVYNILEKKAESERVVYEDQDPEVGFILLPDFKWDQKQTDDLYLIAIVNKRNIKSLRDLTSEHLPLLQNIFQKGQEVILERYKLPASKLRVYLHYQPSYYHLHVHFTRLSYDAPGCGVERAHLLADVIQNLQFKCDYYRSATLYFPLSAEHGLLNKFKEAGRL